PTHGAVGHDDGVLLSGLGLRLAQPVAVAFGVAELERVRLALGQLDAAILAIVEQQLQPARGRKAHVIAAMGADMQRRLQLAVEDHLAALRAFVPEVVRHVGLAHEGPQLRPDEIGQPAHDVLAPLTPPESSRTSPSTASSRAAPARPSPSRCVATRSTSADPTTAPSATLATAA